MFRFTIRDVLWLMVVIGLALGWWVNSVELFRLSREHEYWREAISNSGYGVTDAKDIGPHLYRKRQLQKASPDEN